MPELILDQISRAEKDRTILHSVSFSMQKGEKIGLMGETGSGKTTLLKIVAGLIQPSTGTVVFQDGRVKGPDEVLLPGHPKIGYLSQHFELLNNYYVEEILDMHNKTSDEVAQHLYALCKIDHLLKRRTNEISGGERQRISLAKVLISNPSLVLLDEPFSNLDGINKKIIHQVLENIFKEQAFSCIMVSHNPDEIFSWADRLMILKDGKLLQMDETQAVQANPVNSYVAQIIGAE